MHPRKSTHTEGWKKETRTIALFPQVFFLLHFNCCRSVGSDDEPLIHRTYSSFLGTETSTLIVKNNTSPTQLLLNQHTLCFTFLWSSGKCIQCQNSTLIIAFQDKSVCRSISICCLFLEKTQNQHL